MRKKHSIPLQANEDEEPPDRAARGKLLVLKKKLDEKDRIIADKDETIGVKDQHIEVKEKIIAEREVIIKELTSLVRHWRN